MLSQDVIDHYHKQGYYLHQQQLFGKDKLARLTGIFEEHLANKGEKLSDELDTPHFRDERLFEFLMADEVLDLVECLIGPNIGLFTSHFICKMPHTGRRTPWHEDSAYWDGKFDRLDKIVTVWLALDPSTLRNGCMGVIPGTHTNGFSEYEAVDATTNTFDQEIKAESIREEDAVWFELERGACSLHDGRIIHGAGPNTSPYRRAGYTMRYFGLDMKFNAEESKNQGFKIYHARGENVAENPLIYR
ncbi:phytanoyl-CoA dioxygenase family protein [Marinoscillum furvescens]|uniref:Phytanoyl-CoA dioxygenase PhyH n=1 Tax=Marinoscillum furvescens DSM 4134 TaxID=1122208 RepID=A0A3D9KWC2_MARFU|nr:phytanoyl-CoA dioxygenase family protein [Marinoscillum furvescens]RED92027.1 phytanoyl-CoA dioxygenase PhyH [Marinoscillum furvescens DSM 4134]